MQIHLQISHVERGETKSYVQTMYPLLLLEDFLLYKLSSIQTRTYKYREGERELAINC